MQLKIKLLPTPSARHQPTLQIYGYRLTASVAISKVSWYDGELHDQLNIAQTQLIALEVLMYDLKVGQ